MARSASRTLRALVGGKGNSRHAFRSCPYVRRAHDKLWRPQAGNRECLAESFNGRLRDELLHETLFTSLAQACVALARWRARLQGRELALAARMEHPSEFAMTCRPARHLAKARRRPPSLTPLSTQTDSWMKFGGEVRRQEEAPARLRGKIEV